jgi:multidrug efflux pump subunit AcrA (membrane-fusion protein)
MVLDFPILADYSHIYLDGVQIFATHGHNFNMDNVKGLARGAVLLHGHTHVPKAVEFGEGNVYVNPGSVSIPKENSPQSYILLEDGVFSFRRLADGEEYPHKGTYDYTRQSISPTAGTITIVVAFPNPEQRLKAGEFGEIECGIGRAQRVITLPQEAVTTLQDKHIVWVVAQDSTAQWREVTLGEAVNGRWIIRHGISEGEQVATEGSQKLHQGAKVIPQQTK